MMQKIQDALSHYWGYDGFLSLQKEAMSCLAAGRDSVVVLPTGGGKSLCYQAPAVTMDGLAVVVSPLISLMKDQVDALNECGVSAMRLDSSLTSAERDNVLARIHDQSLKLLYLSPERLMSEGFADLLRHQKLSYIAVDEAHCVSMWGHDFRPEYRQMGRLKKIFNGITIAAYTATATAQVRADIAQQLHLEEPEMLVGSFDRPNLSYKILTRKNINDQVCSVLDRHEGESGVVYCIRRKDVDSMCQHLTKKGYNVAPYHAGMSPEQRQKSQDMFISEKADTIVATIAFGMGIDKSNVRYVIHAGMPKSLEHYQQESGRAGRDGLEAECCLFYSGGDYGVWKSFMRDMPEEAGKIAMSKLQDMYSFCTGGTCRHQAILNYFGQTLEGDNCQACDVCLGEIDCIDDALVTAQKILSCVVRLEQRFGAGYTGLVLAGSSEKRILENNHDQLSTYGLLSEYSKQDITGWIEQLVGQGYLEKAGEYNVLQLTAKSKDVLKGDQTPRLLKPAERKTKKLSKAASDSWEGVDRELFSSLRALRGKIAGKRNVPTYIVFGDAALRDMAKRKPSTPDEFLEVKGVGQKKCKQYGKAFMEVIANYCGSPATKNPAPKPASKSRRKASSSRSIESQQTKEQAFEMFREKCTIEEVAKEIGRAESTATQYLGEYIQRAGIDDPSPWVDRQVFERVVHAAQSSDGQLKSIYNSLDGKVGYDQIRISIACLCNRL